MNPMMTEGGCRPGLTEAPRYKPPVGRRSGVGTGTTSLLMIFTVLCFATLAMLSLSTAVANQRIQERGLSRSVDLAAARGRAAEEVAALDAELLALRATPDIAGGERDAYYLEDAMAAVAGRGWEQSEEDALVFTWVTGVDDANELVTVLRLEPMDSAARYSVVRQNARLLDGWQAEGGGQLWAGE